MAGLSVRVELDRARLDRLLRDLPDDTRAAVRRATFAVQARGMADAPVRDGFLKNSHRSRFPGRYEGRVTVAADYAPAVHGGSRPHVIAPRNARALRFVAGGRTVFARRVDHPGTRANNWLERALRAEEPAFRAAIARLVEGR